MRQLTSNAQDREVARRFMWRKDVGAALTSGAGQKFGAGFFSRRGP
jgi:hypothetical protein